MVEPVRISLDAMGGDHGAAVVIAGADVALQRRSDIVFELYGEEPVIAPLLDRYPRVKAVASVHHCEVSVRMDDLPSQALRKGRWKSSMWRAIEAIKKDTADVSVSAGNTGALMAMSKFCLRSMADIERPAIAAIWPTIRGESIVLDVGATIGAEAGQLVDFTLLGGAMARAVFGVERPTIGLLNIGVEEVKGLEEVRKAGRTIREADLPFLEYKGFVEGNDIGLGTTDVVVTEGFSGNIALKTAEGTARQLASYLRSSMSRSWMARIGYMFAKGAFDRLRDRMDPRKVNGGVFLGLNGIVIKSHGGTDAEGFASAIELGYDMVKNGLLQKISADIAHFNREKASQISQDPLEANAS